MPREPPVLRRLTTATRWPVGVALTSWNYMWRITPFHRSEAEGDLEHDAPPALPDGFDRTEIQGAEEGFGPLFHRTYRTRIRHAEVGPEALVADVAADLDKVAPTTFSSFQKVAGEKGPIRPGEELTVRMAGPWDGPVRVVDVARDHFWLATLDGHLEAGQIIFRARGADDVEHGRLIVFEIESWARSRDRLVNLAYTRLRMAKEIQLHMWTSFLEGVVKTSGGRMTRGIDIETRRVDAVDALA
jgi:hypothetical protein